jgi:hypothetical protein
MAEYRAYVIGSDDHIVHATALVCVNDADARSGRFCWSEPSESGAATGSFSGLNAKGILPRPLRDRRAGRPQNFSVGCEAEHHPDRQAFMVHVVKLNTIRRRLDFLQPECIGRNAVKPPSPIGCQSCPALVHRAAIAPAFQAGARRVQIQQRIDIATPARVEPIHDDGDLVEIMWQR